MKQAFKGSNILVPVNLGLEGHFSLIVSDEAGNVKQKCEFKNLITDLGLNGIGINGTSWTAYIGVGTGTAVPSIADTALSGTLYSIALPQNLSYDVVHGNVTSSPRYSWSRWSVQTPKGAAAGTWTEVGVGRNLTTLWSRELIRDSNGDPTSLVVTSIDYLTLQYELRVYYSETDVTGTKVISGTSHDYIARFDGGQSSDLAAQMVVGNWMRGGSAPGRAGLRVYNGALQAVGLAPAGASADTGGYYTIGSYVSGSYKKEKGLHPLTTRMLLRQAV